MPRLWDGVVVMFCLVLVRIDRGGKMVVLRQPIRGRISHGKGLSIFNQLVSISCREEVEQVRHISSP